MSQKLKVNEKHFRSEVQGSMISIAKKSKQNNRARMKTLDINLTQKARIGMSAGTESRPRHC